MTAILYNNDHERHHDKLNEVDLRVGSTLAAGMLSAEPEALPSGAREGSRKW